MSPFQPQSISDTALCLQGVSKKIGTRNIVTNISFKVQKGEIFGFLGPNGAGKTTTIRLITGLIRPTCGEVYIMGCSLQKERSKALSHIGSIVEQPEMYTYLTGWENLKQLARMSETISDERIREVVEMVKLSDRIKDKVKTYSLGMKQRLGVAQAVLHQPEVLILDEPANGLDPLGIIEFRKMMHSFAKDKGVTVFVSSHILSEIEQLCDRVAIINHGTIQSIDCLDGRNAEGLEEKFMRIIGEGK